MRISDWSSDVCSSDLERRPSLMAEVLEFWPQQKPKAEARFSYPWAQWMALDEDGIGDIWLAEQGIDWPADANAMRFRSNLTTRAKSVSNSRKNRARYVLKRVSTTDGEKEIGRASCRERGWKYVS